MRYKAREEHDQTWAIVRRAVAAVEADPRTDQKHGAEDARKSKGGCGKKSKAREGYGRAMPKDMTELDQGRTDLQAAQRLVMKLSLKNAARTSLWYSAPQLIW